MELNIEAKIEKVVEKSKLSTPVAIILAGIIIAGAILVSSKIGNDSSNQNIARADDSATLNKMGKVSKDDHIRGSLDAKVIIVEYSDTECPFCKQFHTTMKQIMAKYNGEVAWVYRHFPIDSLHSKARNESLALECAAELGGNDKFWEYTDRLYEVTLSNNRLDPAELPKIAESLGLDVNGFNACLAANKYASRIENDLQNAKDSGGRGTPWSIVIGKGGKRYALSGAYPFDAAVEVIEQALKGK